MLSVRLQGDATEAEREESRWISAQFQPADPRISVRSGTGGVSFHGCESGWVWMGDCRGGFYACSLDGTAPLIAGIWESDGKTAEELASGLGGTNLPPFAVGLTVANRKVGARGTGRLEADGTCRLFLLFGLEGRSWCLHLATRGVKGEQEALDLVRSAGVQAFLRDCLLFDAGKEELI